MEVKKAIVIIGATASGKSELAAELCKRFDGEVISADSMQVYRRMDIGTAKPTADELAAVRHHLIDIRDFNEKFSAADFITEAKTALADISARGRLPFVVGGTGMYSEMLFDSSAFSETGPDEGIRESLRMKAESEGNASLWEYLRTIDPEAAEKVHPNNVKRVVRYLEIFLTTGLTPTEMNVKNNSFEREYEPLIFWIGRDVAETYERIDRRVDIMMEAGLAAEAEELWRDGLASAPTASQAIGYKELFPYFEGKASLDDCVSLIKQHSRNYAKRQKTYFRRVMNAIYVPAEDALRICSEALSSDINT